MMQMDKNRTPSPLSPDPAQTAGAAAKPGDTAGDAKSLPAGDGFSKRMLGHWRTADGQACNAGTNITIENGMLVFTAPGARIVHRIVADAPLRTQASVVEPATHSGEEYVLTPEFNATSDVRSFNLVVQNATTGARETWDPCEL